MTSRLTQAV